MTELQQKLLETVRETAHRVGFGDDLYEPAACNACGIVLDWWNVEEGDTCPACHHGKIRRCDMDAFTLAYLHPRNGCVPDELLNDEDVNASIKELFYGVFGGLADALMEETPGILVSTVIEPSYEGATHVVLYGQYQDGSEALLLTCARKAWNFFWPSEEEMAQDLEAWYQAMLERARAVQPVTLPETGESQARWVAMVVADVDTAHHEEYEWDGHSVATYLQGALSAGMEPGDIPDVTVLGRANRLTHAQDLINTWASDLEAADEKPWLETRDPTSVNRIVPWTCGHNTKRGFATDLLVYTADDQAWFVAACLPGDFKTACLITASGNAMIQAANRLEMDVLDLAKRLENGGIADLVEACEPARADSESLAELLGDTKCRSCGEGIDLGEHAHECIGCGATLCNYCFSASARCPTCED